MIYFSKNLEDTAKIAEFLAKKIKPNSKSATIVALSGELGAGKTHLTQRVAKLFGIKKKLASPTFVIMKFYEVKPTSPRPSPERRGGILNFKKLIHIDAYRLKNSEELLKLGWKEILKDSGNLIFIEWPENVRSVMPKNRVKICLKHKGENKREIEVKIASFRQ